MLNALAVADAAFLFLTGATRIGEAFLFAGPRATSTPHRHQHDPHSAAAVAVTTTAVVLSQARPRTTITALRMTPAKSSTKRQPQSSPDPQAIDEEEGTSTSTSEGQEGAAQPPPLPKDSTRRGTALDGTSLAFRPPTTEDMHKLRMGDWVAQRGIVVSLVALDGTGQETKAAGEVIVGAPLVGAVVESMDGVGGSSVATRVCLLRHRREDGVSEAVEHALLDETINQFLNDGARISQVTCV